MHLQGPRFLCGAHCIPRASNSSSTMRIPSRVRASVSVTHAEEVVYEHVEMDAPACGPPPESGGPVPGWRTTSRFLLSSPIGMCQKPSRTWQSASPP